MSGVVDLPSSHHLCPTGRKQAILANLTEKFLEQDLSCKLGRKSWSVSNFLVRSFPLPSARKEAIPSLCAFSTAGIFLRCPRRCQEAVREAGRQVHGESGSAMVPIVFKDVDHVSRYLQYTLQMLLVQGPQGICLISKLASNLHACRRLTCPTQCTICHEHVTGAGYRAAIQEDALSSKAFK